MGSVAYHEPRTITEVADLLSREGSARCLAGGQILVAEMNAGLPPPDALISLRHVEELREIERKPDGTLSVGAMATHRMIVQSDLFRDGHDLLRAAASCIASPAIRSTATIGGSICRGDPRLDYPAVLLALDATIHIRSAEAARAVPAREFFVGFLQTALCAGEFVTRVEFPPARATSVGLYERASRVSHEIATVSLALVLVLRDGVCSEIALALGSCGPTPVRSAEAEARLRGSRLTESDLIAASQFIVAAAEPASDVRGTSEYRSMLIPRLVQRAVARAKSLR